MSPDLLAADCRSEAYKGALHLAMFGLAVTFAAYSAGACVLRPCPQLKVNTLLYLGLACFEARRVFDHWRHE